MRLLLGALNIFSVAVIVIMIMVRCVNQKIFGYFFGGGVCKLSRIPEYTKNRAALAVMLACAFIYSSAGEARRYSFDASQLNGGGKGVDLTIFEEGAQLPGIYPVDIILNGARVDTREMFFHTERDRDGSLYLKTCLTRDMLVRYGVKVEDYPGLFHQGGVRMQRPVQTCQLFLTPRKHISLRPNSYCWVFLRWHYVLSLQALHLKRCGMMVYRLFC